MQGQETPVAVVTGGASGIGEAAVRRFVQSGWHVVIADINDERGKAILAELKDKGHSVAYHHTDVTDESQVSHLLAQTLSMFGRVDALVNSGGILQNAIRTSKMPIAQLESILDINVKGSVLTSRAFGDCMAKVGRGSIVNLGSLTSFVPSPQPAYAMSKVAIASLTKIMACELGPQGVRVNAVAPGYTLTPAMQARIDKGERDPAAVLSKSAIRRFVQPAEVGEAIFFLCSPAASAITGIVLPIDCGWLAYSAYSSAAAQPDP